MGQVPERIEGWQENQRGRRRVQSDLKTDNSTQVRKSGAFGRIGMLDKSNVETDKSSECANLQLLGGLALKVASV